jgi:acyl carrier protein
MGLDAVDIVVEVEETFDIVIEDSQAEKIITPRQLIELVLGKVGNSDHKGFCLTQRAFHRLRASLMRELGCKRNQITPQTTMENLFPLSFRKERISIVIAEIGTKKEIEFVRPAWVLNLIHTVMILGGIVIACVIASHPNSSRNIFINLLFGSPLVPCLLFILVFGRFAFFATRWMRIKFGPSMSTVGQFSRWIVANSSNQANTTSGQWSREQVSEKIRQIVIETLDCEKQYTEDARFVEDLGLG